MADGCPCGTYRVWLLVLVIIYILNILVGIVGAIIGITTIDQVLDDNATDPESRDTVKAVAIAIFVVIIVLYVIVLGFCSLPILAEKKNKPRLFTPWSRFLKVMFVLSIIGIIGIFVSKSGPIDYITSILGLLLIAVMIFLTSRRQMEMAQASSPHHPHPVVVTAW